MKTSRRLIYSGRVQGVGFRYSVKQTATGFDVTGWVRNLADGTVEVQVAGEGAEIEAFVAAVAASHLGGYFTGVRQGEGAPGDPGTGFEIRQ